MDMTRSYITPHEETEAPPVMRNEYEVARTVNSGDRELACDNQEARGWESTPTEINSDGHEFAYDANGRVTTYTDYDGAELSYTYDALGRPTSMSAYEQGNNYGYTYNAAFTGMPQEDNHRDSCGVRNPCLRFRFLEHNEPGRAAQHCRHHEHERKSVSMASAFHRGAWRRQGACGGGREHGQYEHPDVLQLHQPRSPSRSQITFGNAIVSKVALCDRVRIPLAFRCRIRMPERRKYNFKSKCVPKFNFGTSRHEPMAHPETMKISVN